MADIALTTPPPLAKLSFTPIIKDDLKPALPTKPETFNPDKHLAFVHDPKKLSLKDVSLPEDVEISPVACSEQFHLFTEEAIQNMRQEIFTTEVWENCLHSTRFAPCQLRGHCPKYAPFMNQAWKNPKTLAVISQVAGEKNQEKAGDNTSVTKWHYDAFPFVCVVMMSDATNMGSAVIPQGRYVEHQALAAIGGAERITMITSFRPRNPCVKDDSVLTSIRPISEHSELYYQWAKYRVEVVQERLKTFLKTLAEDNEGDKPTNVRRIKEFLAQQQDYIGITNEEIAETRGPHLTWEGS
ncbi:hypothetical protein BDP81DRAFT_463939 [Colletotrichum phormii]|uniref:Uncharacterized protein n=1 Tax=Colletotrichum phormii TaxID=359342 RepID=A0AAJ0ED71_9PEZI|nr:uncharacterized protein BDP81DRAFT_463939 [Colletotrichum phormii]KAK1625413.1 hypothetical protein BDP81DRAFT_463939 [Colletotrichum phormii]